MNAIESPVFAARRIPLAGNDAGPRAAGSRRSGSKADSFVIEAGHESISTQRPMLDSHPESIDFDDDLMRSIADVIELNSGLRSVERAMSIGHREALALAA